MASVTFERVTKQFDEVVAVNNLNITVQDQEFLVLVGPSGCGKTTSLRMLAGLESVSDGSIYIGDRCVNHVAPKDRDIAMVFQSYALYPHMSVFENMAFSLELRGMAKREIAQRVHSAAKQMGIEELLHRKPKELSGGQRQRVAVCRAIVRNPAVFLMDEPLSNLDAKLRVQARAEIGKLHKELETTFIYVTHDQVEAMTMGTRIAVLNRGVLQQIDTPQTLYTRPNNVFVAGFIGSPAMNFLDAVLLEQNGNLCVKTESFQVTLPERVRSPYAAYQGKSVILGIRPESMYDRAFVPPGVQPATISARVTMTEMMGHEIIVYLEGRDSQELIARVDPRSHMTVGESVEVVFDLNALYLFDRDTEQLIQ